MEPTPAGGQWLKEHYNLVNYNMTHASYIANNPSIRLTSKGNIEQEYGRKYAVEVEDSLHHVEFYLKYDDLSLDFLQAVFLRISKTEVEAFVSNSPASKQLRRIAFLYEFLTSIKLNQGRPVAGNYIDLLDANKYITGTIIKNTRWRINNNLTGNADYCPIIRKTPELKDLLKKNLPEKIQALKDNYPEEIFQRATSYLYTKETKSSYEIEKEQPSPDRTEKFVALLRQAGAETDEEMLEKQRLINLQNAIVDHRFASSDFRNFQNYVGESLPNYQEYIHYICPPPSIVESLMKGLQASVLKNAGVATEVKAGMIAFGFVFIHPFEDGNGRLHRFLIHDVLTHDKLVPQGLIIPVSAHMLNNMKDYDNSLEKYSGPLMKRVKFLKTASGDVEITNINEVTGYYRYPDLTDQCIYLVNTIQATAEEDLPNELLFVQRYDTAKREIQKIVDMPDKMISMMLTFLHQNKGIFPKKRRTYFEKLTDEEIELMQEEYKKVYDLK